MNLRHTLLIFFLLGIFLNSYSKLNVETEILYLTDTEQKISNNDILSKIGTFKDIEINKLNFAPNNGNIWLLVKTSNRSSKEINVVCEIDNLFINPTFLPIAPNEIFLGSNCFRPIDIHSHNISYNLASNVTYQFLVKVESLNFPTAIPLKIKLAEEFARHATLHSMIIGFIVGLLFVIIFISLNLWIFGRSRMSAFLFGFLTATSTYFLIMEGLPMLFLGYENRAFAVVIAKSLLPLSVAFLGLYLNDFFDIKSYNLKRHRLYTYVGIGLICISILFIIFHKYSSTIYQLSYVFVALGIIYLLSIPYDARARKGNQTTIITTGLVLFALFLSLKIAFDLSIINLNIISSHCPKIGYLLLITCISIAIAKRFRKQSSNLKSLNNHLDLLVKERTVEINNQNEELKTQTEEMEVQKEELETQKEELEAQKEELITQKEMLITQNVELERLELVASKTENVIYIFSPEGSLVWFNSSFSSLLGMTYNDFISVGKDIQIDEISSNSEIRGYLEQCLKKNAKEVYESPLMVNGKQHWYQTTLTPISEDGVVKYVVAIDSEITRLKHYEIELEAQQKLAVKRKNELEEQQSEMNDSLRYAQRIQTAILPQGKDIKRFFPESFVLFKPRDIVSGDFYWFHRIGNKFVFIVVDCTGHGVPGAFMSIIGNYLLNNIIIQNNETRPAEILKQLNRKLKISLKNENSHLQTNDGMDVSLVTIDLDTNKLFFSGALRPLFLCTQGDFLEIKGDKIPITSEIAGNVMAQYKEWDFDISKGDRFYMFTDGIIDQFGGNNNKKFLTKRFKQLILDAQSFSLDEQQRLVNKAIMDWRGEHDQIDDILVMGIEV